MCGRYAMSLPPSVVRRRLRDQNMPVDDAPEDDDDSVRQTYNFAPSNHGLVYRAQLPHSSQDNANPESEAAHPSESKNKTNPVDEQSTSDIKYNIQAMKWGLVPFWTKRAPDYSSTMRTINCRDDSLAQSAGMWNSIKHRKRCIIICEGFYEWLKKNNGRDRIPHFVKRNDDQLMCFAGLWDCVQYEGQSDNLYTYTIITTDSNKQLKFLHDRMPVILDNRSDAIKTWLDPARSQWSKELQSLLKPFDGDLECYPVDKAVGKVGNNSPTFVIPIDSKENKNNIANFFQNQKKDAKDTAEHKPVEKEGQDIKSAAYQIKKEPDEDRDTTFKPESTEDNAPLPKPTASSDHHLDKAVKRERSHDDTDAQSPPTKSQKTESEPSSTSRPSTGRKLRSSTTNNTKTKSPSKADGTPKITNFFTK